MEVIGCFMSRTPHARLTHASFFFERDSPYVRKVTCSVQRAARTKDNGVHEILPLDAPNATQPNTPAFRP